jgi:hypothetical protein
MVAITLQTTYVGPTSCDASQIDGAFRDYGLPITSLGRLIMKWAPLFGFRGEVVAGQIGDETAWGTNLWTLQHNNILSIGVTGESTATPQTGLDWQKVQTPLGPRWLRGYHFDTIEHGLLAGLIHMATYIYGKGPSGWPSGARAMAGDRRLDPRLPALLATSFPGTVKLIGDLGNGKFAAASGYGQAIASRANLILGKPHLITKALGIPSETTAFYAWLRQNGIPVSEQYVDDGWVGRGGMQPEAIVHHVTDGYGVMNAINWWKNANVDGSTQQLVAAAGDANFKEGTLVIARRDEDQAWANGAWGNPDKSIPTVARWFNQNINPNRVTLSREHVGKPYDKGFPSALQMRTSLYADLQWVAKYPTILIDRAHFLKHSDIDSINRSNCPGPQFPLDKLIADVFDVIQNGQEGSKEYDAFLMIWGDILDGNVSVLEAWQKYWQK